MIVAACVVGFIALLAGVMGIYWYRRYKSKAGVQQDISANIDAAAAHEHKQVPNISVSASVSASPATNGFDEMFEDQYHPKSDIVDIYGVNGDIIIKKINEADDVVEEEDDDDENGGANNGVHGILPTDGELHTQEHDKKMQDDTPLRDFKATFGHATFNQRDLQLVIKSGPSPASGNHRTSKSQAFGATGPRDEEANPNHVQDI